VDSDTAAYIIEARRHFEDLRQVESQLAGLLVLAAAGARSAGPHHPMLKSADHLYQEAVERLHHTRVTPRAQAHHDHLLRAATALRSALSAAHRNAAIDAVLRPLRAAHESLHQASRDLPGFDMVAFEQGCCGRKA